MTPAEARAAALRGELVEPESGMAALPKMLAGVIKSQLIDPARRWAQPLTSGQAGPAWNTPEGQANMRQLAGEAMNIAQPLSTLYHYSTSAPFKRFDPKRLGQNTIGNASESLEPLAQLGFWFTDQSQPSRRLSSIFRNRMTADVPIDNPRKFESLTDLSEVVRDAGGPQKLLGQLKKIGHDSIAVVDEEMGGTSYIPLDFKSIRPGQWLSLEEMKKAEGGK
jgi:hypothetical protein